MKATARGVKVYDCRSMVVFNRCLLSEADFLIETIASFDIVAHIDRWHVVTV